MKRRAAWLMLTAAAAAASSASLAGQLAFAIAGIGVVGMLHGAGDLAVVEPAKRPAFLSAYAVVSLATMLWWTADPSVALPAFLVASAVHFGLEDAPHGSIAERGARGIALIAAPAALHPAGYASLLRVAGGASFGVSTFTPIIAQAGGIAGTALLWLAWRRRDVRLAGGMAALLLLPPLVGFTIGFLMLHALPQTFEHRDRLGCSTTYAYLRTVAPVFAAAVLLAGLVAVILHHVDPSGVRGLFAGIAALAMPHLLVTPLFEPRDAREPAGDWSRTRQDAWNRGAAHG
ncbi:Brp/Blh family beta-carotene 15,15'-monooxygenase [Sphingomonas jinjuensis]|uniref:Probable beta-carotene 15,15'-dioxygenase n=1 Tax=Sphingomonas jinjuensis TaxID=535907 RepID=A0A840F4I7_9SPHN|nr:Brp/Blh family beta-carotene 15,15'-dioxygenase [Sphingomonas jinjuensis]MBB4154223.1 Brp/Blh family beta-carotene 15,15'-monooxygenase [Sphingomonas jinjuensis]